MEAVKEKLTREEKQAARAYQRAFYRGNRGLMALGLAAMLGVSAVDLGISWIMRELMDVAVGTALAPLARVAWLSLGLIALLAAVCALNSVAIPRFLRRASLQYKEYAFRQITRKSISSFGRENTGRYISALTNDAGAIESGWLTGQFKLVECAASGLGALIMMLCYSPLLTAAGIALSLLPLCASLAAGGRMAAEEKRVSGENERFVDMVKDLLTGFQVVKSFRAEEQVIARFNARDEALEDSKCRRRTIEQLISALGNITGAVSQLGVFLIGGYLAVTRQGVTPGTVIVFVQLMNYILQPIGAVPSFLAQRKAAQALTAKLASAVRQNVRREGVAVSPVLNKEIRFRDVSFGYEPDKPVLRNVSCTFEAGKSYAIVGASGCGKSTLMRLITGGYDGYTGSVTLDGVELRDIASDALFEMISLVQQNVFVFNDSIGRNMTMFRDFPAEEIDAAARQSGMAAVIAERGLDYPCGENGCGLSGGERQRLSIARCLLRRTPVMLIDEATAALDNQTAREVSEAILSLTGLTRIVVTHRLEAPLMARYDRIYVLRGGTVCEAGSFDELMAQDGYFKSLFTVAQEA